MADYGVLMGAQCPGCLGDSSVYNIDGACFVSEEAESIICGKIVTVKSIYDGQYKEISDRFTAKTLAYGVAMRSHIETFVDDEGYMAYRSGDPINVISNGRAWVLSENINSQPTFGQPVKVGADGFASADGWEVAGWIYTGGWQKWNSLFYMVEIQINQSAPHIHAGERTLVNGAVLTTNLNSPQAPNKYVTVTVEVSPRSADDKTGTWHVDNDQCEILPLNDTQARLSTKNEGSNEVHVTWAANDGSGTQAMIPFTFLAGASAVAEELP